jgi:hypothetical protein
MKSKNMTRTFLTIVVLFAAMLACNVPGSATEAPATEPPTAPPTELVTVVDTPTIAPATEIPIQHLVFPVSLPPNRSGHAGDNDSSVTADQKKANGGDRFTFERFERPFNAESMDVYYPNLDIIDTFVYQDDTWIYGTIQVVDRSAASVTPYRFAMQLDVEVDGKGDFLVIAADPASIDWTTDGVQVYTDANSDVGDLTAMLTDAGSTGDGFETMIFDQGKGDDPDTAWIRVSPDDANTVEIAVKRSALGNPFLYLVDMWAGHGTLDPALFDYSDHYTHEQAGSADPELPNFYPIKSVYELDNSCRIAVGFQPKGTEPGLCRVLSPVAPDQPPAGCQLTDAICAQQGPGWYFDPADCSCKYFG